MDILTLIKVTWRTVIADAYKKKPSHVFWSSSGSYSFVDFSSVACSLGHVKVTYTSWWRSSCSAGLYSRQRAGDDHTSWGRGMSDWNLIVFNVTWYTQAFIGTLADMAPAIPQGLTLTRRKSLVCVITYSTYSSKLMSPTLYIGEQCSSHVYLQYIRALIFAGTGNRSKLWDTNNTSHHNDCSGWVSSSLSFHQSIETLYWVLHPSIILFKFRSSIKVFLSLVYVTTSILPSMLQAPPSDISQDDKNGIFVTLDVNLNSMVLQALLHSAFIPLLLKLSFWHFVGLYTGIVAVTLWTICTLTDSLQSGRFINASKVSSPKQLHSTLLFTMITILYMLLTTLFAMAWTMLWRMFIKNGDNYYTVITALGDQGSWWWAYSLYSGISGGISTFLVDVIIVGHPPYSTQWGNWKALDMAMLDLVGSSIVIGTNTNGLYHGQYRWVFFINYILPCPQDLSDEGHPNIHSFPQSQDQSLHHGNWLVIGLHPSNALHNCHVYGCHCLSPPSVCSWA